MRDTNFAPSGVRGLRHLGVKLGGFRLPKLLDNSRLDGDLTQGVVKIEMICDHRSFAVFRTSPKGELFQIPGERIERGVRPDTFEVKVDMKSESPSDLTYAYFDDQNKRVVIRWSIESWFGKGHRLANMDITNTMHGKNRETILAALAELSLPEEAPMLVPEPVQVRSIAPPEPVQEQHHVSDEEAQVYLAPTPKKPVVIADQPEIEELFAPPAHTPKIANRAVAVRSFDTEEQPTST